MSSESTTEPKTPPRDPSAAPPSVPGAPKIDRRLSYGQGSVSPPPAPNFNTTGDDYSSGEDEINDLIDDDKDKN